MQHKETKKCINFDGESDDYPSGKCEVPPNVFQWCIQNVVSLDTSGCATVTLDTNGFIRVPDECLHVFDNRDIFKVQNRPFAEHGHMSMSMIKKGSVK